MKKNKNKKFLFLKKRGNKNGREVLNTFIASMLIVSITSSFFSFIDYKVSSNSKDLNNKILRQSNLPTTEEIINKILAINDVGAATINYKALTTIPSSKVSLTGQAGDVITYSLKFKNTGSYVWRNSGSNQVVLRVKDNKTGLLKTDKWVSSSIVSNMTESVVNVGKTGEFKVSLKIPTKTVKESYVMYIKSYGQEIVGSSTEFTLEPKSVSSDNIQASTIDDSKKELTLETVSYISSDKDFDVIDSTNSNVVLSVKTNEKVNVFFNQVNKTYSVSKNGLIYYTSKNKLSIKNTSSGNIDFGGKKYSNSLVALKSDFDIKPVDVMSNNGGKVVCASVSVDCTLVDNNTNSTAVDNSTSNIPANTNSVTTSSGTVVQYLNHQYIKNDFKIRVGISHDLLPATIVNTQNYNIVDGNNNLITVVNAGEQVTINYDKTTKLYSVVKNNIVVIETPNYLKLQNINNGSFTIVNMTLSPYGVNYNVFIGDLELRYNSTYDNAWIINELFMEDYLKGIGEASNSSSYEYLKVMAVTARTYATYHYLNDSKNAAQYFNVFSTTADQVYYGYKRQLAQPNVVRAVDETRGMYITYSDKIIQAFYSANAGGKTRTLSETWGGSDLPYLQSVVDKYTTNDTRFGHGVGMSQVGAIRMIAYDNADFVKVLTYYYTGTQIEKLY